MSLAGYASKAIGLIEGLRDGWSEEDFSALRSSLRDLGFEGWETWRSDQRSAVSAFVAATPQRQRAIAAVHPEPLLLKMAAI